jgi:hypothetical protein
VRTMKRSVLIVSSVLLALILALPCMSDAAGRYYGRGYGYHGGYGHGWYGYGWYRPRVFIGPAYVAPWYYPVPPPVYAAPPTGAYALPAPEPGYDYPDPAVTQDYGQSDPAYGSGEWVMVPGQYVDGRWIAEHKAWVPANR